jgi:hypothetical protein
VKGLNTLKDFDRITCRLAIQVCVGHFPDGRERHRTFSIKNIDPNADPAVLASLVRDAIAPLLAFPITRARLVTKKIRVLFRAPTPAIAPAAASQALEAPPRTSRPGLLSGLPGWPGFYKNTRSFAAEATKDRRPKLRWHEMVLGCG